jgi:hypothetical protein
MLAERFRVHLNVHELIPAVECVNCCEMNRSTL